MKQQKKMFRPIPSRNVLREHGLTIEDLIQAYEEEKAISRAANKLGISTVAFHKTMVDNGYVFTRGKKTFKKKHTSVVAEWLRKHPNVTLPRNYKKIAEVMDIPIPTVRAYFKRRQERMKSISDQYNDIVGLDFIGLKLVDGTMITNKGLKKTRVYVDDFALCYIVKATTLTGSLVTMVLSYEEYLKLFKLNKEDYNDNRTATKRVSES